MTFVHLHTHSHYSIGRAMPSVRDLVRRAAELEMPALALTDNNSIAGLHELETAAREFHIQPILGCELDILPADHSIFQGRTHRLTLLVENDHGYRNLVELITKAHDRPSDVPPHVRFTELERHGKGLIALTGSPRGELYHHLREGNPASTKEYLNRLAAALGRENIFFEIIEYAHPRTRKIMDYVLELSRFLGLPAVATQNVHYLYPQDTLAYTILAQYPRATAPVWPLPECDMPTRHFTTPTEMSKRFHFTPEILEMTTAIAARCSFSFPKLRPQAPVPVFERGQDASTVLWDRAIQGATAKYAILNEKVKERLNREYGDIRDVQGQGIELSELLLFLQDITSFLKDRELCRGVGKGKWTTSVIAYALGIVNADPLTYDLEYQTLRATHNTFPPFEIEVSSHGMEQLLAYLREKYHDDHLAAVGHRVDWKTPDLFHRLCRWANLPIVSLRDVPHSGNMSPPVVVQELKRTDWLAGKPGGTASSEQVDDLEIAGMQQLPDTDVESGSDNQPVPLSWLQYDEVKKLRHQNVRNHKTLAEAARALHPCPKGFEAQKGGYVLAKDPIHTNIPVLRTPSGRSITQSEAPLLDRLQMPRLQFSSFTMLNILEFGQNAVREESDPKFLISSIPLNDEDTWKLLGLGYTNGIPPLHSISTKSLLRAERPQSIKELLGLYIRCRKRRLTDGELAVGFESRADAVLADALSECTLGYWAAYLKTHYRPAFMISVLTHTVQTQKTTGTHRARFQILLREARKMMQLDILGPDINLSVYEFSLESRGIRTGLMAVQGMGEQTYREIANVRQGRDFSSLADFCHRTDPRSVNQTQITQLIKAGAFDALDPERNRNHLLQEYERALKNARLQSAANTRRTHGSAKSAIDAPIEQLQLFDTLVFEEESTDGDRQTQSAPLPTPQQIMQYEQESVGYIFTYDLYDQYRDLMQSMRVISPTEIHPKLEGKQIFTAGFIDHAERESPMIDGETDVVLDFEGIVVKVPRHATDFFAKVQHAQGLVLIQGMVRKQSPTEAYLIAQKFYNFDDVKRAKDETKTLQLNLTGMDQKAIAMVRSTLKNFKGNTSVEIQGVSATSWWAMRGLDKAKVLFCPPLIAALCPYPLSESQLRVIDAEGKSTKISM